MASLSLRVSGDPRRNRHDARELEFTSIYARIQALRASASDFAERANRPPLLDFHTPGASAAPVIPFALEDYLTLVDWSGRAVRADKRSAIDPQLRRSCGA